MMELLVPLAMIWGVGLISVVLIFWEEPRKLCMGVAALLLLPLTAIAISGAGVFFLVEEMRGYVEKEKQRRLSEAREEERRLDMEIAKMEGEFVFDFEKKRDVRNKLIECKHAIYGSHTSIAEDLLLQVMDDLELKQ